MPTPTSVAQQAATFNEILADITAVVHEVYSSFDSKTFKKDHPDLASRVHAANVQRHRTEYGVLIQLPDTDSAWKLRAWERRALSLSNEEVATFKEVAIQRHSQNLPPLDEAERNTLLAPIRTKQREAERRINDILMSPSVKRLNTWDFVKLFGDTMSVRKSKNGLEIQTPTAPEESLKTRVYQAGQQLYAALVTPVLTKHKTSHLPHVWDPENPACLGFIKTLTQAEGPTPLQRMETFQVVSLLVNPTGPSGSHPLTPATLRALMTPDENIARVRAHGYVPENVDRMLLTLFTEASKDPRQPLYAEVETTEKGTVRLVISREKGVAVLTPTTMLDLYDTFKRSIIPGRLMDTVIQTGRPPYIEKMEKLDPERMRAAMAELENASQNGPER